MSNIDSLYNGKIVSEHKTQRLQVRLFRKYSQKQL